MEVSSSPDCNEHLGPWNLVMVELIIYARDFLRPSVCIFNCWSEDIVPKRFFEMPILQFILLQEEVEGCLRLCSPPVSSRDQYER
ncbi:unnamed protein product [Urochloa humidicola]